jgi:hypothetical protein
MKIGRQAGPSASRRCNSLVETERERVHQRLEGGWRYHVAHLSQLVQFGETPRCRLLHMCPRHQVGVEEDAEIVYCRHRIRVNHDTVDAGLSCTTGLQSWMSSTETCSASSSRRRH